jgi:hypothetical protein
MPKAQLPWFRPSGVDLGVDPGKFGWFHPQTGKFVHCGAPQFSSVDPRSQAKNERASTCPPGQTVGVRPGPRTPSILRPIRPSMGWVAETGTATATLPLASGDDNGSGKDCTRLRAHVPNQIRRGQTRDGSRRLVRAGTSEAHCLYIHRSGRNF